jgi:hypothetical protein
MLGVMLAGWLLGALPVAAQMPAQTPARAGVIVVQGDGTSDARCVGFTEAEISGYELLARAGFELYTDASSMGTTICRINGEGCGEGESCFCQCEGGPCRYWTYWRATPDGWHYAELGAGNTRVTAGVLEAWVWGAGERGGDAARRPPELTFDAVCAADAPVVGLTTLPPTVDPNAPFAQMWLLGLIFLTPLVGGVAWWWFNRRRAALP